jgi:cell division protein FtsN
MSVKTLNERGASSWDLVLKILSITLVSLFAFSSGIWFGQKLSESEHQRQALEGEFDREVRKSSDSVADHQDHGDDALTDEEVAAATDKALEAQRKVATDGTGTAEKAEQVAASAVATTAGTANSTQKTSAAVNHATSQTAAGHATGHADTAPAAAAASIPLTSPLTSKLATQAPAKTTSRAVASATSDSAKPDLSAAHQAAARVANNAAPTTAASEKQATESRVPSSLPKTVGTTSDVEFTVQVASYPTADAAREHVDSMVKKGFPAFPVEAKINGKIWYRVSVGSFKSFNDASKFRAQLLKQADLPSAIVQKIAR